MKFKLLKQFVNIFLCLFLNMIFGCKEINLDQTEEQAKIIFIKGHIMFEGKELSLGDSFPIGKDIQIDNNSYVDVKLSSGSIVRLKNANVRLNLNNDSVEWNLVSGIIYSYVPKKNKNSNYRIITPISVMGVRGTRFVVDETQDKTYICVCEGKVAARFIQGKVEKIVSEGEDLYLELGRELKEPEPSPSMKNMADEVFKDMGLDI